MHHIHLPSQMFDIDQPTAKLQITGRGLLSTNINTFHSPLPSWSCDKTLSLQAKSWKEFKFKQN